VSDLALTPFVPKLLEQAQEAARTALIEALGVDGWGVDLERGEARHRRVSLSGPADVKLALRPGAGVWTIGGLAVTVSGDRAVARQPGVKELLRHLGGRLDAGVDGRELEAALEHWDSLARLDDTFYARLERSTNGVSGMLLTGFGCNQDCHFCWQGRSWPDPPEETVFAWLEQMAAAGLTRITISGGEPTMARYLPRLVERAARTHGMAVHLNTNAIRFRNRRYCRELLDAGLSSVLVSLHAADPGLSDQLTRAPKTHGGTVAGIHSLLAEGAAVILNCVVERDNVEQLPAHAAFLVDEFVSQHPDNPLTAVNYSQPGPYFDRGAYPDHIAPLDVAGPKVVEAANRLDEAGVLLLLAGTCGFPACAIRGAEHLLQWRDREDLDERELSERSLELEACRDCAARDQCVGVRAGYRERWGERGLSPYAEPITGAWAERVAALPESKRALLGLVG